MLREEALDANDPAVLARVENIANGYDSLAKKFEDLSVPEVLRAQHGALITATMRLGSIAHAFAATFDDAVYVLAVLPEHFVEADRLTKALSAINVEVSKSSLSTNDDVVAARQALGL